MTQPDRGRLAHDLHEELGPTLAAIALRVELASSLAGSQPARASALLAEVQVSLAEAIGDVRRLANRLSER